MRYALILSLVAWGLSFAPRAAAANFGCESVAGSVIFKDTMYGVLTGSLLSGLYLLSQNKDNRDNVEQSLSGGAAIGGLLGFGLGITEIALRECPGTRVLQSETKGLSSTWAAVPLTEGQWGAGWRVSWRF